MRVTPQVLEGYLARMYVRDSWRLCSWTQDDYLQEGMLIYLGVEQKYQAATDAPHMMALFKTSWWRHVHDKARAEPHFYQFCENLTDACDDTEVTFEVDAESSYATLEDSTPDYDLAQLACRCTPDAQAMLAILTAPGDVLGAAVRGIVLSSHQARAFAERLGWSTHRVRSAVVELLEEIAMPTPIQTLSTATGVVQRDGEDRQAYLIRIINATSELADDAWAKVPPEAQNYYNKAAEAMNATQPLPDLPDEGPAETKAARPISAARKAQDEKRAAAAAKKAAPTPAADANAASAGSADAPPYIPESTPAVLSPTGRAREIMCLDIAAQPAAVREQLKAEGYPLPAMSALQAMRSDIRSCLKVLEKHGMLRPKA